MKKILVTGGAGFIGSHLVNRLLEQNHKVIVIDDFSTGKLSNLPVDHPNLDIYTGTILDAGTSELYEGIDTVFHLAALTRPQESVLRPQQTFTTNINGTLQVLLNCQLNKVKRLVFASSASVYGNTKQFPTKENSKLSPIDAYGFSKMVGEQLCSQFEEETGLETNCLRFFNTYGSRQNPEGQYSAVVPYVIKQLTIGKAPFLHGDGKQSRDFIYVEDVVYALLLAAESDIHNEIFNVGSGKNVTINSLFRTISEDMGVNIKPIRTKSLKEQKKTVADISKIKKLLDWEPKTSIKEGIRLTIHGK